MNNLFKRLSVILLSVLMISVSMPVEFAWATDGTTYQNEMEVSDDSGASIDVSENVKDNEDCELSNDDELNEDENNAVLAATGVELQYVTYNSTKAEEKISSTSTRGSVTFSESGDSISGTAKPANGYDLASIRIKNDSGQEQYATYKKSGDSYSFSVKKLSGNCKLIAYFGSTTKWDGMVDVEWYDPDKTEYSIGTPAQLAGVAAITNGMVDENVTKEYMIKDNEGRSGENGKYSHKYISTMSATADLLTPNTGKQVRDIVWRLPKVSHKKLGEDDVRNDFLYRTVKLTADIDMGDCNWTPIGGKYAMNPKATDGKKAKVIDTRFQGVFDGQGHTVTINTDRRATLGFAYAMEIALIGYLGGAVDYKNGYPKDTYRDYANYWVPTARNIVVKGSVKGRRMVAGVVGRTGETNCGVLVENCVNYADVMSTDMRGCAGIVGAAWGKTTIRSCYNAGTIHAAYDEIGGIVGNNGYEGSEGRSPAGADIYNCYNIGDVEVLDNSSKKYKYEGFDIGADGGAFAGYTVANCYYLKQGTKSESGYSVGSTSKNSKAKVIDVKPIDDKAILLENLNRNGDVFVADDNSINNGYPILYFQSQAYKSNPSSFKSSTISIESASGGTVKGLDFASSVSLAYGEYADFVVTPNKGMRFVEYSVNDGSEKTVSTGNFYAGSGKNVKVKGVFDITKTAVVTFPDSKAGEDYYVTVTKVYDANSGNCSVAVKSGDTVSMNDVIKVKATMKKAVIQGGKKVKVHPDIKYLEYTGEVGDAKFESGALTVKNSVQKTYTVTGDVQQIEITYKPKTQGKMWTTVADTKWYKKGKKTFVIKNAKQLAGVAKLSANGVTFKGVTIKLGKNISLKNTKANSGDAYGYDRNWVGIGSFATPFMGTFDGNGHKITNISRNFADGYAEGVYGGLFGVTEGATIKNLKLESGTYVNDDKTTMSCSFKNGATGGGIVGYALDTKITSCTSNVTMLDAYEAGGIAGTVEGNTIIKNCKNYSSITGSGNQIGGIVGYVDFEGGAQILNCKNYGSISTKGYYVGGILGDGASYLVKVINCENNGSVSAYMDESSSLKHAVGGILGYSEGSITLDKCVNNGSVAGLGNINAVGGIAGCVTKGTISNTHNTGAVSTENKTSDAKVSGISNLGTNKAAIATVNSCYNTGIIGVPVGFAGAAGGVIAHGEPAVNLIAKCYCTDGSVVNIAGKAGIAGEVVTLDALNALIKSGKL